MVSFYFFLVVVVVVVAFGAGMAAVAANRAEEVKKSRVHQEAK
jgi:hypothetical protein